MRKWLLSGAAFAFLAGKALAADTGGIYLNPKTAPLSPALTLNEPIIAGADASGTQILYGSAVGYDFGNGFKTEIEGVTARAPASLFGNFPAGGRIAGSTVRLNGLYELSDGAWHLKPYIGAGFGIMDANARILGATSNDWISAYQLHGGISLGFTQKLVGSLEYRWAMGSKPNFSLAGIPTKVEIDRHRFVLGVNFKY
jgi:opacity protein-like surface antigen